MNLNDYKCIRQIEMLDHKNALIAEQIKLKYIESLNLIKSLSEQNLELSNYAKTKEKECVFLRNEINNTNNIIKQVEQKINDMCYKHKI